MLINRRSLVGGLSAFGAASAASAESGRAREGYAQVDGGRVFWRSVGGGARTPLLTLHGGPGAGHDCLTPLEALADQRPVILYDQLGCGRSDKPDNPKLWRIERFCDEIDSLRQALGLKTVILFGHSWGGWLALDYMARRGPSAGVEALILASTSASTAQFVKGARRLLEAMPGGVAARLDALEAAGKTGTADYDALVGRFYDAHLIHMASPPAFAGVSASNLAGSKTYPIMNGPNEFTVTGNLKDWDRSKTLAQIHIPTLVMTSSLDEFTLDCAQTLHQGIKNSKLVVIPGARHLAMIEKPRAYVAALRTFLAPLA